MANKFCKLRKYMRKKRRAKEPKKFDRLARLYWRYHWQIYKAPENMWGI